MTMLNVCDLTRQKSAVLQNAFNIVDSHDLNQIYSLSFSLPASDDKVQYCQPRHYVRWGEDGELYRIKAPKVSESDTSIITYECEHVITTLCDSIMFGSYQYGGGSVNTRATITWLLSQQKTQNWVLDECDFDRRFEYLWEQENILNALYSIPKEFAQPYKWVFNTTIYPWRLSLKRIDPSVNPEYYLRARSNLLSSGTASDYADICTRIYPLGYGEGVNQLTIKDVNGGVPYLQSPASYIQKYGIVEKVLVDRRYENAESLKAYAQSMLDLYQEPSMSRTFEVTDLYPLTHQSWDNAEVGDICKMTQDNTTAYITRTRRQLDKDGDLQIDLSTKATDIASSVADLADRIRIESVYAQGATQLYQHSKDANATPTKGMVMSLYFPSEMKQINKVLLRMKIGKFRSYSQTAESNGGYNQVLQVNDSSKDITSQTNTNDSVVIVQEEQLDIKTQRNTENEKVKITFPEKIATTDMTADEDQDLTTTKAGGDTGTTSTDNNTLSGETTSDPVWDNDWSQIDCTYGSINAHTTGATGLSPNWISTQEPNQDSFSGHKHYIYEPFPHYHKGLFIDEFTVFFYKQKINHSHKINLSGTGSHNHSFSIPEHSHNLNIAHQHKVTIEEQNIDVPCPSHTHEVKIPMRSLYVPCPQHTHKITLPGWSKTINIPPHIHQIKAGIYESGNATAFDIYVGGIKKATVNSTSYDGDITAWLLNNRNQVPRGTWIDIEIRPNDLAYVQSSIFVQGFVQSRGGGNY